MDAGDIKAQLREAFVWRGDRPDANRYADVTGWWREPGLLRSLATALADLVRAESPSVVLGLESRGSLLGPLVALEMDVGFVEVRKNRAPSSDSDAWVQRTTAPDYHDRHLTLGFRRGLVASHDRVVLVDDWVATGSQAGAAFALVNDVGATWLGIAAVVDALEDRQLRRRLNVRSLLHLNNL